MLRFVNYNIVFQEVPGEVTLAINLSNCPNRCKGCHSPYLREDIGKILDNNVLAELLEKYGNSVTCICFMGGDASPKSVEDCSVFLRNETNGKIKIGWYSGRNSFPMECSIQNFNYIKLGYYDEYMGGLDSETTNQRFYQVEDGEMKDITYMFLKKSFIRL